MTVKVSDAYRRTGKTSDEYKRSFVESEKPVWDQMRSKLFMITEAILVRRNCSERDPFVELIKLSCRDIQIARHFQQSVLKPPDQGFCDPPQCFELWFSPRRYAGQASSLRSLSFQELLKGSDGCRIIFDSCNIVGIIGIRKVSPQRVMPH